MTLALRSQLPDGYLSGWRGRMACTGRGGGGAAVGGWMAGDGGSALVQVEKQEVEGGGVRKGRGQGECAALIIVAPFSQRAGVR